MPPSPSRTTLRTTSLSPQEDHDLTQLDAISHTDHYYNNNMTIIYTPHSTYDVLCEATHQSCRKKDARSEGVSTEMEEVSTEVITTVSTEGMEGVATEGVEGIATEGMEGVANEETTGVSIKETTDTSTEVTKVKEPRWNLNYFTNRNVEGFTLLQGVYYLIENSIPNCVLVFRRHRVIPWRGLRLPPHAARASHHRADSVRSPVPRDDLPHHAIVAIASVPVPRNQSIQPHGVRGEEQLRVLLVRFEGIDSHAASADSGEGDHVRLHEPGLLQWRAPTDGRCCISRFTLVVQNHHIPEFLPILHSLERQYSPHFPPPPPVQDVSHASQLPASVHSGFGCWHVVIL